jgi:hypothetical protein
MASERGFQEVPANGRANALREEGGRSEFAVRVVRSVRGGDSEEKR